MTNGVGAPLRKTAELKESRLALREDAFKHGALRVVRANARMLTVARVHLIDQPNAKRLVFGANVGAPTAIAAENAMLIARR